MRYCMIGALQRIANEWALVVLDVRYHRGRCGQGHSTVEQLAVSRRLGAGPLKIKRAPSDLVRSGMPL